MKPSQKIIKHAIDPIKLHKAFAETQHGKRKDAACKNALRKVRQ